MSVYFAGLDLYNCVIPKQDGCSQCFEIPLLVNISNLTNIQMRYDVIVFQKIDHEYSWFIKGNGFSHESEVFNSDLEVSQVCIAANMLVGFSNNRNFLYKVDFELNYNSEQFSCSLEKVQMSNPSIQIKQIVSNDKCIFVLDDHSGIYEVGETLTLKWRLEGIEIQKMAYGFGHAIVLSDTGALYSWGSGGRGELGHFEHDHVMVSCDEPKRIEFFDDLPCIVTDVSCGGWHTLALTSDGDIYSWGWNESGQLGHCLEKLSPVSGIPYPIDLGSAADPVIQIVCGARHSFAILKSGKCFSWGLNNMGQLGVGDFNNKLEPFEIKLPSHYENKIVKIECGRWSTFIYLK